MARSRRKAGGCTRGRVKLKKMGKGWSTVRKPRGSAKPIVRRKKDEQRERELERKKEQVAPEEQ